MEAKNKFELISLAAFISPKENNFKIIKVNTDVKDHGLTFHFVADYDSQILRDKLDPPAETLHAYIVCPMILMFIIIMMRRYFRLDLSRKLKKKKFRLLMIMKFSINLSNLQTKKK
ncbi:hypothetical protein [Chryseobacterium shandongense]|uniref:hypothetical protein n=1 Tax=Chryseobacterium shandongense TaxID=1493872 RepID=UPI000F4D58C3|nr:hypothetical protein [Chryseobacterium shandongense]AZA56978.1 hypothetical protein EG350_07235 [Chryseobacterium shandongense]